jgi:hypothetical protein
MVSNSLSRMSADLTWAIAGDFVFTVEGYHAAFQVPDHYPRSDRLKIFWDVGGGLKTLCKAYLAVTPKVCMLGGLLALLSQHKRFRGSVIVCK